MPSSNSGSTTSRQISEPWSAQKPYLENIFAEAERLYTAPGPSYYPNATVAPFSPETELALGAQAARAISGSPLNAAASDEIRRTLSGDYLGAGNPYFGQMSQRIAGQVIPAVNSQFSLAGRYGSGAHTGMLADQLSSNIGQLAYQNFGDERMRMQQAATAAPTLAQQDYADIGQLAAVGQARERLAQDLINDQVARFNFDQQLPYNRLAQYMGFIQGDYGGTTTHTQPSGRSFLEGAVSGAGLVGTLAPGGPAWAPWLGAALGGLLSL